MRKRILILLPLIAALSACWQSDEQLIPADEAANLPIAGTYTHSSDGTNESVTITADRDRYYIFHSPSAGYQLRYLPLTGDWYLVQAQEITDSIAAQMSEYRIVKLGKNEIDEYDPTCSIDDDGFSGVSVDDGDCTFSDFESLREAALSHVNDYNSGKSSQLDFAGSYKR